MSRLKTDMFFELIRGIYGASKYEAQWPDTKHEESAKILWDDLISKHSEIELRNALDHAQRMSANGERDWQWPNIGLILSGARLGMSSHRPFKVIEETPEQKARWKAIARVRARQLLDMLDGKETPQQQGSDNDFGL